MSQLPAEYVKRGLWINIELGPVMGRIITTDTQTGNLVVALLALLTTLGQAFLRTLPTPCALLLEWIKLWWMWRKTDKAFLRSWLQILLGLIFTLGTVLIGVLVSLVVKSTDIEVCVDKPHCGPWNLDAIMNAQQTNDTALNPYRQHMDKVRESSRAYVRECYQNYSITPERCKSFTRPSISFTQERLDCPFTPALCKGFEKPAIRLDSGLVDLNDAFGLNLDPTDRVKVRKTTTCAVLEVENRVSVVNMSSIPNLSRPPLPNEQAMIVHLGSAGGHANFTYALSLLMANLTSGYTTNIAIKFWDAYNNAISSTFIPPLEMQSSDADLVAIFIAKNEMRYRQPINDPFFAAHRREDEVSDQQRGNVTFYNSDFPISALGCTLQYQFCHAQAAGTPDSCSNLTGIPSLPFEDIPNASGVQVAAMQELVGIMFETDIQSANLDLKAQNLAGNFGFLASLPDDQWSRKYMVEYAIGKSVRQPDVAPLMKTNLTEGKQKLCGKQKMRNPGGFVNINVFALAFVCTFTCVVTIIDLVLLKFFIVRNKSSRMDRWFQDGVYQLQRRAYDAHGEGTWRRLVKEVPLTDLNEKLSELPNESCAKCSCSSVKNVQLKPSKTA
ncbi:hypothetical protein EPUS_06967 [Endocarpon pusillum Z07020]|uniref:Uncharacterized protein n=1 Tax=Endocarpon pusillum (strain Z07020 / HMAS-L-300199) TaxID=1263415 RepID=U1I320_ENDPU|nr:uncharacterized protein EPUS_06967 [Endocarpon pusillum Z07020]ERF76409.1 hypothetical protein EPUS_06967 [Endocarpon pusillum Z07020]